MSVHLHTSVHLVSVCLFGASADRVTFWREHSTRGEEVKRGVREAGLRGEGGQ